MAEPLPLDYERSYLDLLHDYHSDETKKTRRNLAVASFIIIVTHLAGVPVTKLKLPYYDAGDANAVVVVASIIVLLLYWSVMLAVYTTRDYQVQKERRHQLNNIADYIDQELEKIPKQPAHSGGEMATWVTLHRDRKASLDRSKAIIADQRARTKDASWWNVRTRDIEYTTTALMALAALIFLIFDLNGLCDNGLLSGSLFKMQLRKDRVQALKVL